MHFFDNKVEKPCPKLRVGALWRASWNRSFRASMLRLGGKGLRPAFGTSSMVPPHDSLKRDVDSSFCWKHCQYLFPGPFKNLRSAYPFLTFLWRNEKGPGINRKIGPLDMLECQGFSPTTFEIGPFSDFKEVPSVVRQ
jgi:hypothetical protein